MEKNKIKNYFEFRCALLTIIIMKNGNYKSKNNIIGRYSAVCKGVLQDYLKYKFLDLLYMNTDIVN